MTREAFDRELKALNERILRLGNVVEEDILKAAMALKERDLRTSREMIAADEWVNNQRIEIMMASFTLIATQQPAGPDMRALAATIEIAGELERIHDYVKGLGKISLKLAEIPLPAALADLIPQMAAIAGVMLQQALDAFAANDATLARAIPVQDNDVDELYRQISYELTTTVTQDSGAYENANLIQWAVHNLERSADRVINICEWVVYKAVGKYVEMDSEYEAPATAVTP
ncbi:MAG: phosphate signaling complex protein PhoU [Ardenticatenaceae bacterium]|nr:phosphate signaling complex protein PhoU [Ardenticatenaceae bacterium]MCB8988393.1 phosphate signaling complex protein PhoU [Ardenticatenaceae bacterium]